jgi:hypothetical protein
MLAWKTPHHHHHPLSISLHHHLPSISPFHCFAISYHFFLRFPLPLHLTLPLSLLPSNLDRGKPIWLRPGSHSSSSYHSTPVFKASSRQLCTSVAAGRLSVAKLRKRAMQDRLREVKRELERQRDIQKE